MERERALADLQRMRGGLVVSCQAREDNPLHGPAFMAAMARAAVLGGAAGIRADGVADVAAIREAVGAEIPIMGIFKVKQPDGSLFITPTAAGARAVLEAGARFVALDGTHRPRSGGESLAEVIAAIHEAGGAALADVATPADARHAQASGADAVGTTLSGYTADSQKQEGPDFALLDQLVRESSVPVFAEGRFWTPEQVRQAMDLGAAFVVVGTAITNPTVITARFVGELTLTPSRDRAQRAPGGYPAVEPGEGSLTPKRVANGHDSRHR